MPLTDKYKYTEIVENLYKEKIDKLKTFYCREDFEYQLSRVKNATPDSVQFCKSDLEELCRAKEIDTDELINDRDRSLLKKIPKRVEMKKELLQFFYDMYKEIPTTQQIMERIVRTLAPEYNNDEIRVAILKKFVSGAGDDFKCFDTNSIIQWVINKLDDSEKEKMEDLDEKDQKEFLILKINDDIFDDFDKLEDEELIQDDALTPKEIISLIIQFSEKHREVKERIREKILKIQEEMEDINSELVASKEKDFRKELKQINTGAVKKNGKPQTYNDVYTQAKKDAKKKKRKAREKNSISVDTKLLKLCNDLANGIFRAKGTTKKYLYYFALMFEMNFSLTEPEDRDKTDIRNMFQDYYNDNLLRFLKDGEKEKTKEDNKSEKENEEKENNKKLSTVETEPTGEGINYKNFAETIYLYFLYHKELDMSPGEKIDTAEDMIQQCVNCAPYIPDDEKLNKNNKLYTDYYKGNVLENLLRKPLEEVVECVTENYLVIKDQNNHGIMVNSEEKKAFDKYGKIIEELEQSINGDVDISSREWTIKKLLEERFGQKNKNFSKILELLDDRTRLKSFYLSKNNIRELLEILHILINKDDAITRYFIQKNINEKGLSSKKIGKKIDVLKNLGFDIEKEDDTYCLKLSEDDRKNPLKNELIECVKNRNCILDKELEAKIREKIISKKRITRSELIILHYYYIVMTEGRFDKTSTFQEIFEEYSKEINLILEECRYQTLNKKNFFDMYMIIELYFYVSDLDMK